MRPIGRAIAYSTVGQQLAWLREAGFVEVSCSYRNLIFAVLSGTKPANVARSALRRAAPVDAAALEFPEV